MPSLTHLHTFERMYKNKEMYRCVHPDCSSFYKRDLLEGKRAMCKCGQEFIITNARPQRHFQYAELKCDDCRRGAKSAKTKKIADALMDDILSSNTGEIEIVMKVPSRDPIQLELVKDENQPSLPLVPVPEDSEDEHEWED